MKLNESFAKAVVNATTATKTFEGLQVGSVVRSTYTGRLSTVVSMTHESGVPVVKDNDPSGYPLGILLLFDYELVN